MGDSTTAAGAAQTALPPTSPQPVSADTSRMSRAEPTAAGSRDRSPVRTPGSRPRKRLTAAGRREQLLNVAISVFGARGFGGSTTKAIAAAAGVSEATIFRHFPSKDALYVAALEQRTGVGSAQLVTVLEGYAERQDDEGLLRVLIRSIFFGYERDRDLHRMLLYGWLEQGRAANTRMWARMRRYPLIEFLERYVARRQAAGVFCAGPPRLLCGMLLAVPTQHAVHTKLYGVGGEATDDDAVAAFYARLLLGGVRADAPAGAPAAGGVPRAGGDST